MPGSLFSSTADAYAITTNGRLAVTSGSRGRMSGGVAWGRVSGRAACGRKGWG